MEGTPPTLRGLVDTAVDIGVKGCGPLCRLATALIERDDDGLASARSEVVAELGDAATVTAIGVVANFQMMNRALDAAGVPARPDPSLSEALGLDPDEFGGAHGAA